MSPSSPPVSIPPARAQSTGRPIDLDALLAPAGEIRVGQAVHAVLPIDGAGYHALQQMGVPGEAGAQAAEAAALDTLYTIAARCVPTLSRDAVWALTPMQVQALLEVASGQVRRVERLVPNGARPTGRRARRSA